MQYFKIRYNDKFYWFPINIVVNVDAGPSRMYYNALMIYNTKTGVLEKCNPIVKFHKYQDVDDTVITPDLAVEHYLELRGAIKPRFEDIMDDYIKRAYAESEPEEINEDDK